MPIQNNSNTYSNSKFTVFYKNEFGEFKKSRRLVPYNVRKQAKGLGAATFTLKRNYQTRSKDIQSIEDESEIHYAGEILGLVYSSDYDNGGFDSPGKYLWLGVISSITEDKYATADSTGQVFAEEIGWYYGRHRVIYKDADFNLVVDPPDYNPLYNNSFCANYDDSTKSFRTSSFDFLRNNGTSKWTSKDKVWTRKMVIKNICDQLGINGVKWPWEDTQKRITDETVASQQAAEAKIRQIGAEQGGDQSEIDAIVAQSNAQISKSQQEKAKGVESDYKILNDWETPISFKSYSGESLSNALDELIQSPLGYYWDYNTSADGIFLVVYNKAIKALTNVCPAADIVGLSLDKSVANCNVTQSQEEYDEVIVEGNKILWCGSMATNDTISTNSLNPDWTKNQQEDYIYGKTAGSTANVNPNDMATYRKEYLKNVYTKFKFNKIDDTKWISKTVGDKNLDYCVTYANRSQIPFHGLVQFNFNEEGSTGDIMIFSGKDNPNSHTTPNKINAEWADFLPFDSDFWRFYLNPTGEPTKNIKVDGDYATEKNSLRKPFFVYKTIGPNGVQTWGHSLVQSGLGTYGITNYFDGIQIEASLPEIFDSPNKNLFNDEIDSSNHTPVSPSSLEFGQWLKINGTSQANPFKVNISSHWGTFIFTVAGYSKQKLKVYKTRDVKKYANKRSKTIVDDSLNLWIISKGTCIGIDSQGDQVAVGHPLFANTNITFRNDTNKAMDILNAAWDWLSTKRKSLRIEYGMMVYDNSINIGDTYTTVQDGSSLIIANSSVESIEYLFDSNSPRTVISTQFPELPQITLLARSKISNSEPTQTSPKDSRDATLSTAPRRVDTEKAVITGLATDALFNPQPNMWRVIVGKPIGALNLIGAKRLTSLPGSISPEIKPYETTSITQDGFAIVQNSGNGEKRVIVNCDGYSSSVGDVYAGQTLSISDSYIKIGEFYVSTPIGNI